MKDRRDRSMRIMGKNFIVLCHKDEQRFFSEKEREMVSRAKMVLDIRSGDLDCLVRQSKLRIIVVIGKIDLGHFYKSVLKKNFPDKTWLLYNKRPVYLYYPYDNKPPEPSSSSSSSWKEDDDGMRKLRKAFSMVIMDLIAGPGGNVELL